MALFLLGASLVCQTEDLYELGCQLLGEDLGSLPENHIQARIDRSSAMRQLLDLTLHGSICVNNFDFFERTLQYGKTFGFRIAIPYDSILVALRLSEIQSQGQQSKEEDFRVLHRMCCENVIVLPKWTEVESK